MYIKWKDENMPIAVGSSIIVSLNIASANMVPLTNVNRITVIISTTIKTNSNRVIIPNIYQPIHYY